MSEIQAIQKTTVARFGGRGTILRSSTALTDEQIRVAAPSVFAESAHSSRSDRYTYIPTSTVLAGLRREGFQPYEVRQGGTRVEGKAEYTKHLLRLRHESDTVRSEHGVKSELVLVTAHDGTSSWVLMKGAFRTVCSNGLIVVENGSMYRAPHKGDVVGAVIENAYAMAKGGSDLEEKIGRWSHLELSNAEQEAFALAAMVARHGTDLPNYSPAQMLAPEREEDAGGDLWRTLNRVQEQAERGGLRYWSRPIEVDGIVQRPERRTTRPVNSVEGSVNLNRALWTLAERMAEIKGSA